MRCKSWISLLLLPALILVGCQSSTADQALPATIDEAGLAQSIEVTNDQIHVRYTDGRGAYVKLAGRKLIDGGTGDIVIVGHDARGGFVAGYMRQDGLPPNCFVDNTPGIERGDYIELHEFLWSKTHNFSPAQTASANSEYPGGTRFCFNDSGQIWGTVGA